MPTTVNQLWPGIFLLVAALAAASDFTGPELSSDPTRALVTHLADHEVCPPAARFCQPEPVAAP